MIRYAFISDWQYAYEYISVKLLTSRAISSLYYFHILPPTFHPSRIYHRVYNRWCQLQSIGFNTVESYTKFRSRPLSIVYIELEPKISTAANGLPLKSTEHFHLQISNHRSFKQLLSIWIYKIYLIIFHYFIICYYIKSFI